MCVGDGVSVCRGSRLLQMQQLKLSIGSRHPIVSGLRDTVPESSKITTWQGRHSRHEVNADLIFTASFRKCKASPKLSPIQPPLFLFWVPDLHDGLGRISSLVRGQTSPVMMLLLSCSEISLSGWRRHPHLNSRDKFLKDVKGNTVLFQPISLLLCTHFVSFIAAPSSAGGSSIHS